MFKFFLLLHSGAVIHTQKINRMEGFIFLLYYQRSVSKTDTLSFESEKLEYQCCTHMVFLPVLQNKIIQVHLTIVAGMVHN